MKNIAFLALASLLLLPSPASAQTTLSLTGGMNVTSLATETGLAANYNSANRMFAGLAATLPITGPFQVRFGASLSQKGNFYGLDQAVLLANPNDPGWGRSEPSLDVHLRMGYLEFTVLGGVAGRVSGSPVTVYMLAGPAIGVLTSCSVKLTEYENGQPGESDFVSPCYDEESIVPLDLGLSGGAGLNVGLTDQAGATVARQSG